MIRSFSCFSIRPIVFVIIYYKTTKLSTILIDFCLCQFWAWPGTKTGKTWQQSLSKTLKTEQLVTSERVLLKQVLLFVGSKNNTVRCWANSTRRWCWLHVDWNCWWHSWGDLWWSQKASDIYEIASIASNCYIIVWIWEATLEIGAWSYRNRAEVVMVLALSLSLSSCR